LSDQLNLNWKSCRCVL